MAILDFDHNATTALDPAVRERMLPFLSEIYGNPSSLHALGRQARAALDEAREDLAAWFRTKPSELIFTSGGTESNNLAIFGAARARQHLGRHIVTTAIEHHAVLHPCQSLQRNEGFEVTYVAPNAEGQVSVDAVEQALRPDTILVSVMAANNETGAWQPFREIGERVRPRGILLHTDAVQWFGKEPVPDLPWFQADLVSLCAHKFHGPRGAGLLYVRSPLALEPILLGGGHENERRAGTENLPAIVGLTEAIRRFVRPPVFDRAQLEPLTQRLIEGALQIPGVRFLGPRTARLANTASFTVDVGDSITLLAGLDLEGVCASSGSACSAGSLEPSHVLAAMGLPPELARSFVRFSLGRYSPAAGVDRVIVALDRVTRRLRGCE